MPGLNGLLNEDRFIYWLHVSPFPHRLPQPEPARCTAEKKSIFYCGADVGPYAMLVLIRQTGAEKPN